MTGEADEEAARALGRLLGSETGPQAEAGGGAAWQRLGERRLLQAARSAPRRSSFPRAQWVAGVATAACAVLAASLLWSWQPEERALDFVVRGEQAPSASVPPSARIEGARDRSTWVDFSDGSQLEVHAGSSARLQDVRSRGATVVLERGGLMLEAVPAPGASWSVLAGPYEVRVVGTRFTTLWEPREQTLSVRLERGSVRILGTDIQEAVELRPGQRFDVRGGGGWSVTALDTDAPEAPAGHPSAPEVSPAPEPRVAHLASERQPTQEPTQQGATRAQEEAQHEATPGRGAQAGPSQGPVQQGRRGGRGEEHGPAPGHVHWTELVNSGQSERVVELAEQRGVNACLDSCSTEELRALADAARYTGRITTARAALLALRARGPEEASRAAYFLGSLAESRGQAAGALEWYTKSLGEAPAGPFSAEARAGRMRALLALGRREEARRQAREYLRLHPTGVAAERAQQLSSGP